jgi:flagellar protein FliS
MSTNPYKAASAYRDHAVTTASPARIVVLVFERLTLDMERALAAIEAGGSPHPHLIHAQELLTALLDALDVSAWEHAPKLASIYVHVHNSLVQANVDKDADRIRTCLNIICPLRDAWAQAALSTGEFPATRIVSVVNV